MLRRTRLLRAPNHELVTLGPRRTKKPGSLWPGNLRSITPYAPLTESTEYNHGSSREINYGIVTQTRLQKTDAFTIHIWARMTPETVDYRPLISTFRWLTWTGWMLTRQDATDLIAFQLRSSSGDYWNLALDSNDGTYGDWILVSVVNDGSGVSSGVTLYIDGVAPAQTMSDVGSLSGAIDYAALLHNLLVGSVNNQPHTFEGRLAHSLIVNRATTPAEMKAIAAVRQPINATDVYALAEIVHWCTLGNGCATGAGNCPDLSPLGNDGTEVNGVVFGIDDVPPKNGVDYSGPITLCTDFDGTDDAVAFPWGLNPVIGDKWTYLVWVKYAVAETGGICMSDMESSKGCYLQANSSGDFRCQISDAPGGSGYFAATKNDTLDDSTWHLIGLTYDGSNAAAGFAAIKDGILDTTLTTQGFPPMGDITNAGQLVVGGRWDSLLTRFEGKMCHSAAFGTNLDKYDVYMLYGDNGKPKDIVACGVGALEHWCTLGDGCADGAGNYPDISGKGNHGTFDNGPPTFVADVP